MAKHQNKNQQKPVQPIAPPPPAEESKGIFAKVADAIDHVIHPDAAPKSEPDLVESSEAPAESYKEHMAKWPSKKERGETDGRARGKVGKTAHRCPTESSDLEQHPKFSKFKKGEN